jgi:hypothetical protein
MSETFLFDLIIKTYKIGKKLQNCNVPTNVLCVFLCFEKHLVWEGANIKVMLAKQLEIYTGESSETNQ